MVSQQVNCEHRVSRYMYISVEPVLRDHLGEGVQVISKDRWYASTGYQDIIVEPVLGDREAVQLVSKDRWYVSTGYQDIQ